MKTSKYKIALLSGKDVEITCQKVKVRMNDTIFYSDRVSITDQYLNGPIIHAVYKNVEYRSFVKVD